MALEQKKIWEIVRSAKNQDFDMPEFQRPFCVGARESGFGSGVPLLRLPCWHILDLGLLDLCGIQDSSQRQRWELDR